MDKSKAETLASHIVTSLPDIVHDAEAQVVLLFDTAVKNEFIEREIAKIIYEETNG